MAAQPSARILSERRADTIKKYLVGHYGINGSNLVTVGYGKTKPKDPNAPLDPTNRRVQVVNMESQDGGAVTRTHRSALPKHGRRFLVSAVPLKLTLW